jgi:hypothetical protein
MSFFKRNPNAAFFLVLNFNDDIVCEKVTVPIKKRNLKIRKMNSSKPDNYPILTGLRARSVVPLLHLSGRNHGI